MIIFPGVVKSREEITDAIDSVAPDVKTMDDDFTFRRDAIFSRSSSSFLWALSPGLCTEEGLAKKSSEVLIYSFNAFSDIRVVAALSK